MEEWMENEEEMSLGDILGLVKQFESAQSEDRNIMLDEESYERIIQFYQDNREFKRAISVADVAMDQYPYSPAFYILKAEVLGEQRSFDESLEMLEKAQHLDATELSIYLIRADIYLWTSQHTKALEQVQLATEFAVEKEDFADIYLLKASIYEDLEQYLEVIDALEEAILAMPENLEALNRIWFATEIAETFERSEKFHKKLTDAFPYNHYAWFNLGHAYYYQNKFDEAIEAFGFATAIEDDFEPAHLFLGDVYYEIEDYVKAQECYFDAINTSKPFKESFFKLAETFEKMGDMQKARHYLRKATNIDTEYDEAFHKIGETYMQEENFAQAIPAFERALKISPSDSVFLSSLGDAYLMNDDPAAAIPHFQKAIELEPHNLSHYVHLGSAFFELNEVETAFDTFEIALRLFADSAEIRYIYAVYLIQAGSRKHGLSILSEAIALNPKDAKLVFNMDNDLLNDEEVVAMINEIEE